MFIVAKRVVKFKVPIVTVHTYIYVQLHCTLYITFYSSFCQSCTFWLWCFLKISLVVKMFFLYILHPGTDYSCSTSSNLWCAKLAEYDAKFFISGGTSVASVDRHANSKVLEEVMLDGRYV